MKDFSFQGKVYLGERLPGGRPGKLRWVGDAPTCNVALTTESESRRESYSGNRMTSATLQLGNDAELTLTLNWLSADNLALGLYGTVTSAIAGTVTAEALPADLVEGDQIVLARAGVTDLVITDSTGTPATVDPGDYTLDPGGSGVVTLNDVASYTQPLKAAYSYAGGVDVTMFTAPAPERFLLLDGINTLDGSRVKLQLYRVKFNPASNIPAINDSFGQLELTGAVLYDAEAAADTALGGFGKIELPAAA